MKISKIKNSRRAWKEKAKQRGSTVRGLKKTAKVKKRRREQNARNEEERQRLKEEVEQLRAERRRLAEASPVIQQRTLCVLIVIIGIVSFRSAPRILKLFLPFLTTKLKIPHFTSVIHWALRVGIAAFNQVALISGPWVAIVDCSIDVGIRKALVVLRIPLDALQKSPGAIGLQDAECIGLEVSHRWNGPLVSEALNKVFDKAGFPCAIVKDGGTDLGRRNSA